MLPILNLFACRDYIADMKPQTLDKMGNETFYLFGPDKEISEELGPLLSTYKRPVFSGNDLAFSFGIGPSGSGVPFHVHGHGFSEVLHGKKVRHKKYTGCFRFTARNNVVASRDLFYILLHTLEAASYSLDNWCSIYKKHNRTTLFWESQIIYE